MCHEGEKTGQELGAEIFEVFERLKELAQNAELNIDTCSKLGFTATKHYREGQLNAYDTARHLVGGIVGL